MKIAVLHIGSRMHYAVPRIFYAQGMLGSLWTDLYSDRLPVNLLKAIPTSLRPGAIRRLLARRPAGLPASLINSMNVLGLKYFVARQPVEGTDLAYEVVLKFNDRFAARMMAGNIGKVNAVWGFNSASRLLFREAKSRGMKCILEQTIAPKVIEGRILMAAHASFSEWSIPSEIGPHLRAYVEREAEEWNLADMIVCGSDFVLEGIKLAGGPSEKCVVVPYGVDLPFHLPPGRHSSDHKLRVTFVGSVSFRKGAPMLLEVAKRLGASVHLALAGPIQIAPLEWGRFAGLIQYLGILPRSEIGALLDQTDVLLLPSFCEGSATVTYEALARGVAIVTTRNTGSIIRDGVEGYLVGPMNIDEMVDKIHYLAENRAVLDTMQAAAKVRSEFGSVGAYAERLIRAAKLIS